MQMLSPVQDEIATKIKIEMVCNQRNAHRNAQRTLHFAGPESRENMSGLTRVSPGIFQNAVERKSCPIIRLSVTEV